MPSWLLFIVLFCSQYRELFCETVICTSVDPCVCRSDIAGETCILDCTAEQAVCRFSTLRCRDGDACIINCAKRRACQAASITCPSNANCTINCIDPVDTCDGKSGGPFNVTLNQAKMYQCVDHDGIDNNKGVCPAINVPAPFAAPTTAIPTLSTRISTTNEATSSPTLFPINNPTINPSLTSSSASPTIYSTVLLKTTVQETPDPTTSYNADTTNHPTSADTTTNNPTINPTTNNPTINPSLTSSSASPTRYSTMLLSTTIQETPDPTTSYITDTPNHPTSNATMHLSTLVPSVSPSTLQPTTYCSDWTMHLEVMIPQYPQSDNWEIGLQQLLLNVFQKTILLHLNDTWYYHEWCVNIDIQITSQTSSDIDIYITFTFNDPLFDDYFSKYNITQFGAGFLRILTDSMGRDVDTFVVANLIQVTDTPTPTYPPYVLQTRKAGHDRSTVIATVVSIFGLCCLIVVVYTCCLWCRYEDNEIDRMPKYNQHQQYRKVEPTTPSVPTAGATPTADVNTEEKVDELSLDMDRTLQATRKSIEIHQWTNVDMENEHVRIDAVSKSTIFS